MSHEQRKRALEVDSWSRADLAQGPESPGFTPGGRWEKADPLPPPQGRRTAGAPAHLASMGLPCGPVVKTLHSTAGWMGRIPGWRTEIPCAATKSLYAKRKMEDVVVGCD